MHDLLSGSGPNLARTGRQFHFKQGDADRRGQVKDGAAGRWMDEADQVTPIVAVLHRRSRPRSVETPDGVENRLQAAEPDAVLVDGPQFDLRPRKRRRDRLDERPQLLLNSACCSGSARAAPIAPLETDRARPPLRAAPSRYVLAWRHTTTPPPKLV